MSKDVFIGDLSSIAERQTRHVVAVGRPVFVLRQLCQRLRGIYVWTTAPRVKPALR
jgi:hypothetical protein